MKSDNRPRITDNGFNARITPDALRLMHPGFRHTEKGVKRTAYSVKQSWPRITRFIFIFIFAIMTCRSINELQKIRDGNFALVTKGKYQGRLNYLNPSNEYEKVIETLVETIHKNGDVFPLITHHCFTVAESLSYKFMHCSVDQEKNVLVLRYLARTTDNPLYAGYQIQFVFDIDSKTLVQTFMAQVPLE